MRCKPIAAAAEEAELLHPTPLLFSPLPLDNTPQKDQWRTLIAQMFGSIRECSVLGRSDTGPRTANLLIISTVPPSSHLPTQQTAGGCQHSFRPFFDVPFSLGRGRLLLSLRLLCGGFFFSFIVFIFFSSLFFFLNICLFLLSSSSFPYSFSSLFTILFHKRYFFAKRRGCFRVCSEFCAKIIQKIP